MTNFELIPRSICCVCGDNLEHLYTQPSFPVFMGCTEDVVAKDIFADMVWGISTCGAIQLMKLVPLDVLYSASHGSGSTGQIWIRHHSQFAQFISRFSPHRVIEIGGGHGILADFYQSIVPDSDWTIIEPNPKPSKNTKAKFIKGFFDEKSDFVEHYDAIVHSHVLEHIYDPRKFIAQLSSLMDTNARIFFSVPNLLEMLKRKYVNAINFEHTVLLTESLIEKLFHDGGFNIVDKAYFEADHSIFYAVENKCCSTPSRQFDGGLKKAYKSEFFNNKKLFLDFINFHEEEIDALNKLIKDKMVYLFGAHIFSQFLIASGLRQSSIISILDNDKLKQGMRLYGSHLMVESPNVLKGLNNPFLILKAGAYSKEIERHIIQNINSSTTIIL